ncbi:MAG TPA: hypothetical protein DIW64_01825 [Cellvibrio sp.]|nr:hypothetical protein [Cellvibrio sp.]
MNKRKYRTLVLIYTLIGVLWIVGSDWLLGHLIGDLTTSLNISIAKGIGFVTIMSMLLYVLLMKLDATETKASVADNVDLLFLNKIPTFFQSISLVTYAIEVHEKNTRFIWVSNNIARILGYPDAKVFEPNWWHCCLHPNDKLRAIESVKSIINQGGGDQYYRFKHADGSYIYIHDELRAVQNTSPQRFVGVWHDVSGEEQAQQQILDYSTRLEKTILGTVHSISSMVELRDPYTAGHESRVGDIAAKIAEEMGLDNDVQYGLRIAGLVHDIGKISIPSEYLTKPTRLSRAEYSILQTHPSNGYSILKTVDFPWPIADVAHQHHERVDGTGYPNGLKGDEIVLEARIIAVADVIESMATSRPYRHALGLDQALEEVEQNAGTLYDKNVVAAALTLFREKGYQLPLKV